MKQKFYVSRKGLFFLLLLLTGSFRMTAQYCTPTSTDNGLKHIVNFSTSGGITNITNNGTGGGSYNDYTNLSVSALQGASVNWQLDQNFTYSNTAIWVDWNQDNDFSDPGEQVFTAWGNSSNSWMGWNFAVPLTALPGNTRMRVRTQLYDNTPTAPPPCGNTATGETEDYTFQVVPLCATLTSVTATPDQICGSGVSVLNATYNANNTTVTVKWYNSLGTLIGSGNPFTTPVLTTTTTIYAAADNGYCDTPRMPVTITVLPLPTSSFSKTICSGASYTFGNKVLTAPGIYIDTFSGVQCDSIVTLTLQVKYPTRDEIDVVACGGLYNGNVYTEDITLQDTIRSAIGCDSIYRQIHLIVDTFKLSLAAEPPESYKGERVHLTATPNVGNTRIFEWLPAGWFPSPTHAYEYWIRASESGTIAVVGASENGCIDTAYITIRVKPLDYGVFMPNAFSPNGDGRNERFGPQLYISGGYTVKKFRVFNRWGQQVYGADIKTDPGWDGRYANGNQADAGIYYYYIEVQFADDRIVQLKGDVTLVR